MKKLAIPVLTIVLTLFWGLSLVPPAAWAKEPTVWIEETGQSLLGETDTFKEVRERARRDAAAKALEKAQGVFIKSHTLVSNSQLVEDLIYAAVRGRIEKIEVLEESWDGKEKNLYKVKVKALVRPVYPEKGEGLFVKPALSKADLKEGEEVKIFYQANRNCYIYIFSIAADGSVTLLLPNSMNQENFIKAGRTYEFPEAGSPIRLKAQFLPAFPHPMAEERIKVIATKEKEELIPLGFREGMFKVYDAKSTGMISDLVRRLNQLDPADWAEATILYRIRK